ncbi:MAG: methylated-DNA--[protein]-cysteine S-methyltransferase [Gammaproteobacteria bacterium]|nr:methylated-DNA--[protein]-cysteine S-methyltransferase [Gammaproteobacteria bacterium]
MERSDRDYERVANAIRFLDNQRRRRPTLDEVAGHVGLSSHHFQRMFRQWCGVTPKQFLGYLTVQDAKPLLDAQWPVLEVSDAVGLSGPSRLHDLFVSLEAMSPGQYKAAGAGLEFKYGSYDSPFGRFFMLRTARGICSLEFIDEADDGGDALVRARRRWSAGRFDADGIDGEQLAARLFMDKGDGPIPVQLCGTNFQLKVWAALLSLPLGCTVRYADVAERIGAPRAVRAVGNALGANPVVWLVPCHRVIRSVGGVGGYRFGEERKRIMLAWERARANGYTLVI